MTKPAITTILLALCLTAPLSAQEAAPPDDDGGAPWMLTLYGGGFGIADDELGSVGMTSDAGALLGVRFGYRFQPRWAIEASYGYTGLDATSDGFGDVDGRRHLYHADLVFMAPDSARARIALSAGVGGMRYAYDEFERRGVLLQGESWAHELVLSLGAGLIVDVAERVALRGEVRDLVQFCSAEAEPIDETHDFSHCPLEDQTLHNPAFTGGLLVRF